MKTVALPSLQSEIISAAVSYSPPPWYAIRTKSNCERVVASVLATKGYEVFLPCYQVQRRWSDRKVIASVPLFPGYVLSRFDLDRRVEVVNTPGLVSIVSFGNQPMPIPEDEVVAIKSLVASGLPIQSSEYLREGQRVRIKGGPLEHVEGIMVKKKTVWRFVVSISLLQRSVAVEVDSQWVTSA